MKLSAKTEYACLAMLELATTYEGGEPLQIRRIADEHGIPARFLVQILLQLKGAGLVTSTRGAAGGYRLLRSPDHISLGEIVEVIEGPRESHPQSSASPDSAAAKVLMRTWQSIDDQRRELMSGISLARLADEVSTETEHMYYI